MKKIYWLDKHLEHGLWGQLLFFITINVIVLAICMLVYVFSLGIGWGDIKLWEALRLFVDSNGSPEVYNYSGDFSSNEVVLLITECLGTVLFSSLLVAIITNLLMSHIDSIKEGLVHYKFKNHIVIIGYDTIVPSVISEIINNKKYSNSKILFQTCLPISEIKSELFSKLHYKEARRRVTLVHASRQSVEELKMLHTVDAKEIYIIGDRIQSDHDAENMFTFETLVSIHEKYGSACKSIPITIWFENEASYAALQLNDINSKWKDFFEFKPYNFYKRWANRLLTNSDWGAGENRIVYPELDHEGIGMDSTKHVHLIIVGMNRMGTALAKEAAHMMHFPNFEEDSGRNRTRITFIDDNADSEKNFFIGKYSGYFDIAPVRYADLSDNYFTEFDTIYRNEKQSDFLDVQFEFIKGRVESEFVREWIRNELKEENAIITIAVCLHNPSQSFGMAMYLPEEVYTRGRDDKSNPWNVTDKDKIVNIFVRQEKTGSLIKAFGDTAKSDEAKNKKYANIYPFGMVDDSFSIDYYSNQLAMAFNYIYYYYFAYNKTLPDSLPSIEELSDKWKSVSTAEKWSNLYLADSVEFKLRSTGYDSESIKKALLSEEQIEEMAYTEHCRWNMEKLLMGYRTLNEKEIADNSDVGKLKKNMFAHYLIKPYKDLTDDEKELDRNIIRKLPDILRMLKK